MNQQNPPCKLSPKTPPSEKGGKFKQARRGVATPVLMRNKSAMSGGLGGKYHGQQTPVSRKSSKDAKLLCDKCKDHGRGKQNTNTRVDGARKYRRSNSQQHWESVQLTKPDQSEQAMRHGRLGKTKLPKNVNVLSRAKNTSDFSCHRPKVMAEVKPNRARGISNKDVRARRTGELQANIDSKRSKPTCVKPTVVSCGLYG
ncbi:unnamed protein product [Linum trigynum]